MAFKKKSGKPYVWVTWITKLLAGEDKCWFKAWFKAHYEYDKLEEDAENKAKLAEWTRNHDAMVQRRADEVRKMGGPEKHVTVRVEDENAFKLEGALAIVAGKPDLMVFSTGGITVEDAKSGKRRESDLWQIRLYLEALPRTVLAPPVMDPERHTLNGRVMYKEVFSDFVSVEPEHREKIREALKIVAGPQPPKAEPGRFECSRCDIADCKWRFKGPAEGKTDLW